MSNPIRVMCVEDHRIVREGLALIINQEPDMKMVGTSMPFSRNASSTL